VRLFVAIAFTAALLMPGLAGAFPAKSIETGSPLVLAQDKDKGKKKDKKKTTKEASPKAAPAQKFGDPAQRY
jgi:hypothetical protein